MTEFAGVRMTTDGSGSLEQHTAAALQLMEEALELLDQCDAPADIGAHLDLAIQRLRCLVSARQLQQGESRRPPAQA